MFILLLTVQANTPKCHDRLLPVCSTML